MKGDIKWEVASSHTVGSTNDTSKTNGPNGFSYYRIKYLQEQQTD